ncbi:hypothetical protein [Aequorivita sp. CIP111184]|uniref:hypothetical protein n=1 Tax=Aequorivita sp. CIP111184 TaxID=2211356 RepID=UPI000DBBE473|nr:hypothetical protein [Aequorivita sp. CIP111184]SRX53959.1 hypothetical protein AEQU1_01014 [Aequorivita sp. CIP111184]
MAQVTFQVNSYRYYHWSSRGNLKTTLNLYGSGSNACMVLFQSNPDATLPPATMHGENFFRLHYHQYQLDSLIDMLRNESPIFVFFNNDNGQNNSRISTSNEPVGEGELS